METRLSKTQNLLLIENDTDRVVAIIKCKKGTDLITHKLELAIKEDLCCDDVIIADSYTIDDYTSDNTVFAVHIFEDGDEDHYTDYALIKIATY